MDSAASWDNLDFSDFLGKGAINRSGKTAEGRSLSLADER
jgi:hypothetical protein